MVLTRQFRATVQARAQRDARFRRALLTEAINELLARDFGAGKALLRDYINATLGFEALGAATGIAPKSLMRMFGPDGNPQAQNLFAVISQLQKHARVRVEVKTVRRRAVAGSTSRPVARAA